MAAPVESETVPETLAVLPEDCPSVTRARAGVAAKMRANRDRDAATRVAR